MEDTRFVDLTVKVGFPYLYCHQGDCEHLVIITDIRLVLVLLQGFSSRALSPALLLMFGPIVSRNVKSNYLSVKLQIHDVLDLKTIFSFVVL